LQVFLEHYWKIFRLH